MGEGVLTVAEPRLPLSRVDGALYCEDVPLRAIAEAVGTPSYVYSSASIRRQYGALMDALEGIDAHVHYSVKANSSLAVLSLLRELGAGVDIVSGGELYRALQAGFAGEDIVFSGVGKTAAELEAALAAGVKTINVESLGELQVLHGVAQRLGVIAPVMLRVNPDVSVDSPHPYIRTGEHGMKFGIPDDQVVDVARMTLEMPHVRLVGLASHLGSQIVQVDPYATLLRRLSVLCQEVRGLGITTLQYLDLGGGLAVGYRDNTSADLTAFANTIRPMARQLGLQIFLEPGRYIVAEAGVLVTRVLYRKHSGGKDIVITDAGMNDLIRPALYDAYHSIEAVEATSETLTANVVGPVCESGDFFATGREIGDVSPGDLLAIRTTGAYSFVMSSNYNSRPRSAEVLVDGDKFAIVTRRETYDDLVRREILTPEWREV